MPPVAEAPVSDRVLHLSFAADPLSVREGLARIMASPGLADLDPGHRASIELVLAEVLNNVTEHAYGAAGATDRIGITLRHVPAGLSCQVVDSGRPMPQGRLPRGALPQAEFPEGGFGWHLIRTLTRDLSYARYDGQNHLGFTIPA